MRPQFLVYILIIIFEFILIFIAITISAEHGLVISGAKDGTVLIHTTLGDLLRNIAPCDDFDGKQPLPITNILTNRDCQIAVITH